MIRQFCQNVANVADLIVIGGGSPCQDLSALKAFRLGLGGGQSALFYEIPRIVNAFKQHSTIPVEYFVENVFSMDSSQIPKFSEALNTIPYMIDASCFSDAERRRFYWCSWPVLPSERVSLEHMGHYVHVTVVAEKLPSSSWVDPGGEWLGDAFIPTITRALPSKKPMNNPAGIVAASERAIARWRVDAYTFQVYNYEDHHMIYQHVTQQYRLPSAE